MERASRRHHAVYFCTGVHDCIPEGHEGGIPFIEFHGSEAQLKDVVASHSNDSSNTNECHGSTSCACDVHGHGAHCAGIVGGSTYGVAPKVTIHGVDVLSDQGSGALSWIVGAIDWITTKGERPAVLSMSLGGRGTPAAHRTAINEASSNGVTVVVAAGNEHDNACNYSPAYVLLARWGTLQRTELQSMMPPATE